MRKRGSVSAGVLAMAAAGMSAWGELITLSKYAAWGPKEWLPLNIEGMHRLVQANRRGN